MTASNLTSSVRFVGGLGLALRSRTVETNFTKRNTLTDEIKEAYAWANARVERRFEAALNRGDQLVAVDGTGAHPERSLQRMVSRDRKGGKEKRRRESSLKLPLLLPSPPLRSPPPTAEDGQGKGILGCSPPRRRFLGHRRRSQRQPHSAGPARHD